jgi:hypothetical protein
LCIILGVQACNGVHCLAHALWHGGLDAFGDEVGYELPDDRVVLEGGDDPAAAVTLSGGLVEDGVGADQTQEGTEVAAKPYGQGWNQVGEGLGVRDGDAPRGGRTRQPPLQGVPRLEVCLFLLFSSEHREHTAGLFACVGDGQAEESGLVLGVELNGRGRDYEARWAFTFYEAGLDAVPGALDRLVAHRSF